VKLEKNLPCSTKAFLLFESISNSIHLSLKSNIPYSLSLSLPTKTSPLRSIQACRKLQPSPSRPERLVAYDPNLKALRPQSTQQARKSNQNKNQSAQPLHLISTSWVSSLPSSSPPSSCSTSSTTKPSYSSKFFWICTLNLMISLSIFSISVCSSSRRAFARSVSCSYLVNVSVQRGDMI
jgi:hypothetical protein